MLGPVLSDCKKKSIRRFVIMENGKIYAISVSEERGTLKREVEECIVTPQGLEGDGHAGDWSRQITCLRYESLAASNAKHGLQMGPGDMAENILIEGLDFAPVKAGTKIRLGEEAVIEVSQIGKPDHPSIVTKLSAPHCCQRKGFSAVSSHREKS